MRRIEHKLILIGTIVAVLVFSNFVSISDASIFHLNLGKRSGMITTNGPSWPSSWIHIDDDPNEDGPNDDYRDVEYAYYAFDDDYLYLRLECYGPPAFDSGGHEGRFKWFIDIDSNAYFSGQNIHEGEYLLFVEDSDDDANGDVYFLTDVDNDGMFSEWEAPPDYYDSSLITDIDIAGYRMTGNNVDLYIRLSNIGDPTETGFVWATDQENPNLEQGPTTDTTDIPLGPFPLVYTPDVEIIKKVWNGVSWVDSASFNVDEDISFQIIVTNIGNVDLDSYVYVDDDLPGFLSYNDDASPSPTFSSGNHIEWHDFATLVQGDSVVITFSAHADAIGDDDNVACVEAQYDCTTPVSDSDTAHVVVISGCEDEPPETIKEYGQPFYTNGIDDWITTSTPIWLNATDYPISAPSGVLHTFYRILKWNAGSWDAEIDWTIYTGPFTVPSECKHKIEFYSVDNCCNQEEIKNQIVYVDDTPPCSWLKVTDDPDRYVCHVSTITIESLDGGGPCAVGSYTLHCYINGDHYKTVHNHKISFQFNELYGFTEDGRYVVEYWAVDNLGNEESHNTESFFLDTTPPDTEYSFIGPNRWVNYHWQIEPTTKIVLNATDSGAGVDYTLYRLGYSDEGGDWETYTGPFIPDNENIFYASVDKVGNHENLVHLHVEIVDSITNKPPNIPEKPDGQNYGNTKTTYSYKTSTTDPEGDKIKYYFNWGDGTGEWTDFVNSGTQITRTHTWSRAGTYKIKIKAQDENGAESPWSTALTVYLINEDNKPPEKPDKPAGSANGKAGVEYTYYIKTIDPEDDLIYYLVDWGDGTDSGWIGPYESADTIYVKHIWMNSGSYSVKVKAMDYYGEKSDWSESLSVSMPRSKPLTLFNKLTTILEQHFPMLFKILIKMMVN